MREFISTTILALFLFALVTTQPTQAQTYNVLHTFTGQQGDGASPFSGVTIDKASNLYGTTAFGGAPACGSGPGCGTVFKLTHKNSAWILNPLHSFAGGSDGAAPGSAVIFGPDGRLYGTTTEGGGGGCGDGNYGGCGTVFNLKPAASACTSAVCPWTETVLYAFGGGTDGSAPVGDLIFDQAGNIYGASGGGIGKCDQRGDPCGLVYELKSSSGSWTESIVYRFTGNSDGGSPASGVILDKHGNLYGTTEIGGDLACNPPYGCGTVYQLTPSPSGWTESVLYSFSGGPNLEFPLGGLIFDNLGNLYGTTSGGGTSGGTVFELSPSGNRWTLTTLYAFPIDGGKPLATLAMDAAGNLYGTTNAGGQLGCDGSFGCGSVFKLTPGNGSWTYSSLYNFTGGSDGGFPYAGVILDANGNLYGTTPFGGTSYYCSPYGIGCGVVFEIAH